MGFCGGLVVKNLPAKRCRFDPWVRKIPWSRKLQLGPVFFLEEFHGQRSLAGCTVHGVAESDTTEDVAC